MEKRKEHFNGIIMQMVNGKLNNELKIQPVFGKWRENKTKRKKYYYLLKQKAKRRKEK